MVCVFNADCAVRTANTTSRGKSTNSDTQKNVRSTTSRKSIKTVVTPRSTKPVSVLIPRSQSAVPVSSRSATRTPNISRAATTKKTVSARVATTNQVEKTAATETRTGAAYEQCKAAFFTCMDQFCQLKNDSFQRCSCSDRIFDFQDVSENYQKVNERLTEFSENLDSVGLTKEQATAMKTASEGEDALTEDKSASKQLLQAIMNSINGGDTKVGGKYKELNSVTIANDISNAFGMDDSGQIIASYNGTTLYKAVYPKCRNAVQEDCNKASLQRAVNAYLMAVEQDCNTVESALKKQEKSLKASTHEKSAMLDLARVENRRNHNSDDTATCLVNVENAILDEQVCGLGYHKCLDYGQFIDVTTGAPITGVSDFYKLTELLTFRTGADITNQKLSSIQKNRPFVEFFENKTKKFAKDALDKCTEDADFVWQQYLDRALLDIYYAQQDKVKTIKQSCLDLVAQCYDNQGKSIANAMANLTGDSAILLKPSSISLTTEMCSKYIESCNGMFDDNIIQEYIATKDNSDTTSACRAIVQQCFDKFGGTGYNNFYYTQSGLFATGKALDWFSLYEITAENMPKTILSPCAQQLANVDACKDKIEEVFGGFNKINAPTASGYANISTTAVNTATAAINARTIRPTGVATEVYYKILDNLKANCDGLGGYFVEWKNARNKGYQKNNLCYIDSDDISSVFYINSQNSSQRSLNYWYHFIPQENMCPANYTSNVDTQSWGICSCWENGGRRSKNGTIATCRPILPTIDTTYSEQDPICSADLLCKTSYTTDETVPEICSGSRSTDTVQSWCQQTITSYLGQLCPMMNLTTIPDSTANSKLVCADDTKATDETTNETIENPQPINTILEGVPHPNTAQ